MKFQDLIYFVHLVDSKNFTHTANYFFVSQPSISMAVKRLENDLDTVLIKRNLSERTLELMPAGKILYHNAKEIINLKESTYNEIQSLKNQKVQLGLPPIIGGYLLPKIIPHLNKYSSSLELVEKEGSIAMFNLLKNKEVNTAIVGSETATVSEDWLANTPVAEDEFYICVAKNHPLASEKMLSVEQVANERFISLKEGFIQNKVFYKWAKNNHIDLSSVHFTNEIHTVNSLVASGMGISLLIGMLVKDQENIVTIPLKDSPKFYISLLINKDLELTPLQKEFNEDLIRVLKKTGIFKKAIN